MSDQDTSEDRQAPTLTHSQAVKRMEEAHARMEEIGELEELTAEDRSEFDTLSVEFRQLEQHVERLEVAAELAAVRSVSPKGKRRLRLERGSNSQGSRDDYDRDSILEPDSVEDCRFRNPWDLSGMQTYGRDSGEVAGELRARALSAVEKMQSASDNVREAATNIIERFDDSKSSIARMCLATSSPAYLRAWSKLAKDPSGHALTDVEQRAVREVEQFRAVTLTDNTGGYLVPFQLDSTVIVTSAGSRNDIRQVARQVVATGDVWHGVSSTNVSWSWDAEGAEVSDDSTTFAQPAIPNYKAQGFVPITFEALQDEANVAQEVGKLLAGGKMDLEAVAFITGDGSGKPTGIVNALTGTASEINAIADDTFAIGDVYAIQGALPARYRGNASWLANNLIYNKIRAFDTSGGGGFWANLNADRPPQLLGRSALEAEAMDGVIGTSGAVSNFVLIFGDFSNYVITDRIGMSVEFIPNLFHTSNNRPSGHRAWLAHYRTGADSVNDGAFRMLDVASAS